MSKPTNAQIIEAEEMSNKPKGRPQKWSGVRTRKARVPEDMSDRDIISLWRIKPVIQYWCERAKRTSGPRWENVKALCAEIQNIWEGEK